MRTLLFATRNPHKLAEATRILSGRFAVQALPEDTDGEELAEDFNTLQENACQKANWVTETYGFDCFAEDTGLEVYSLGMEPGVHSAHFAGPQRSDEANKATLLARLQGSSRREARFRTVIALRLGEQIHCFEGILEGTISTTPAGEGGFGYDALFVPNGYAQTLAEMPPDAKDAISHRKRALALLVEFLDKQSGTP